MSRENSMLTRSDIPWAATLAAALLIVTISSGNALTMKECSVKYKAAQSAGTLQGKTWNDFRKAECGPTASAAPAATPATDAKATAPKGREAAPARPQTTGIGSPGTATFPSAISPKYSSEPAGRARMHTCLDQYNANKASDRNGGLKWTEKGGGYYSECNKRLKG
jgi:hypothetical protein